MKPAVNLLIYIIAVIIGIFIITSILNIGKILNTTRRAVSVFAEYVDISEPHRIIHISYEGDTLYEFHLTDSLEHLSGRGYYHGILYDCESIYSFFELEGLTKGKCALFLSNSKKEGTIFRHKDPEGCVYYFNPGYYINPNFKRFDTNFLYKSGCNASHSWVNKPCKQRDNFSICLREDCTGWWPTSDETRDTVCFNNCTSHIKSFELPTRCNCTYVLEKYGDFGSGACPLVPGTAETDCCQLLKKDENGNPTPELAYGLICGYSSYDWEEPYWYVCNPETNGKRVYVSNTDEELVYKCNYDEANDVGEWIPEFTLGWVKNSGYEAELEPNMVGKIINLDTWKNGVFDNNVTSLQIFGRYKLTLYKDKDCKGENLSILGPINLTKIPRLSDEVSSIKIEKYPDKAVRVFVTSQTFNGNLGGLSGADEKCQALANAAGLGGTWVAWLSDSSHNASDRISKTNDGYYRLDGVKIAANYSDLLDGEIENPINVYENLSVVGSELSGEEVLVWTGTNSSSGALPSDPQYCSNWLDASHQTFGYCGKTSDTDQAWSMAAAAYCDTRHRLYCFEKVD